jgi:hypothetical protein
VRALFAMLAVAMVVAACSDVPTNPSATPTDLNLASETQYCPPPFTALAAKGHEADNNLDGVVCRLEIVHDDNTIHTTYVDNNVPVQLGSCPNGFDLAAVKATKPGEPTVDGNGDGWACQATRPNGNVVVIDNRFEVEKGTGGGGETPAEPAR